MKKSNRRSKGLDSPKAVQAAASVKDKQELQAATPMNISRERILDGASTTTELLSQILQRRDHGESLRHWGINE